MYRRRKSSWVFPCSLFMNYFSPFLHRTFCCPGPCFRFYLMLESVLCLVSQKISVVFFFFKCWFRFWKWLWGFILNRGKSLSLSLSLSLLFVSVTTVIWQLRIPETSLSQQQRKEVLPEPAEGVWCRGSDKMFISQFGAWDSKKPCSVCSVWTDVLLSAVWMNSQRKQL